MKSCGVNMFTSMQVAGELAEEAQDLNQAVQEEHSERLQALKTSQEDRFRCAFICLLSVHL